MAEEVEPFTREVHAVRVCECVLYRQPHIGYTQLSLDSPIGELHCAMYDALRMYEYLYLACLDAEEPFSLDNLEALVHHRCRVNGYFSSHVPCRMSQCVSLGNRLQPLLVHKAEWSSAGGEQNFLYGVIAFAYDALEDSRVFAIDRDYRRVVFVSQLADKFACHHECFLVGKTYFLVCTDGVDGRSKSCVAHHSRQYHVYRVSLDNLFYCLHACINLNVWQVGEQFFQSVVMLLVGYYHCCW